MRSVGEPFYDYLKEAFPEDYHILVQQLTDAVNSAKSGEQARQRGFELTSDIRHRYSKYAGMAPDSILLDVVAEHRALMNAIRDGSGNDVCAKFAFQGGAAILNEAERYLAPMQRASLKLFQAIRSGMDNRLTVESPLDSDWVHVAESMLNKGYPDRYIEIIANEKTADNEYCDAIIAFLDALSTTSGDAAYRVRALLVSEMASN